MVNLGNVRLVGMTEDDLQGMYRHDAEAERAGDRHGVHAAG